MWQAATPALIIHKSSVCVYSHSQAFRQYLCCAHATKHTQSWQSGIICKCYSFPQGWEYAFVYELRRCWCKAICERFYWWTLLYFSNLLPCCAICSRLILSDSVKRGQSLNALFANCKYTFNRITGFSYSSYLITLCLRFSAYGSKSWIIKESKIKTKWNLTRTKKLAHLFRGSVSLLLRHLCLTLHTVEDFGILSISVGLVPTLWIYSLPTAWWLDCSFFSLFPSI